MTKGIFITGTDTDVGKTYVGEIILRKLQQLGIQTAAMKPVASGAQHYMGNLQNDDALRLQRVAKIKLPYELLNPYVFAPSIAPHLAAAQVSQHIDLEYIKAKFKQIVVQADFVVVEGVGGWLVPLGADHTVADLCRVLDLPVLLVIGMRLGCLNHALLTVESMARKSVNLVGWVANCIDPGFDCLDENVQTLCVHIKAPLLGVLTYGKEEDHVNEIHIETLL